MTCMFLSLFRILFFNPRANSTSVDFQLYLVQFPIPHSFKLNVYMLDWFIATPFRKDKSKLIAATFQLFTTPILFIIYTIKKAINIIYGMPSCTYYTWCVTSKFFRNIFLSLRHIRKLFAFYSYSNFVEVNHTVQWHSSMYVRFYHRYIKPHNVTFSNSRVLWLP